MPQKNALALTKLAASYLFFCIIIEGNVEVPFSIVPMIQVVTIVFC